FGELPVPSKFIASSYPMRLKGAGYRIGFAGKYGMRFGGPGLKHEFDFMKPYNRSPYLKKMPDGSLRHETDLCADAAIEFIKTTPADTPFCLSLSFNASHAEDRDQRPGFHFQWPESADGLYDDLFIPLAKLDDESYFRALPGFLKNPKELSRARYFWRWDTPEKYQVNMRAYFRMITGIDNAVARILAELEAAGLADNTVIVYTGDNGFMMGDRGLAGKWNHYEQSLQVPLIVYDPTLPQERRGQVIAELGSHLDIAPTIVEWAGLAQPAVYQGESLVKLLKGEDSPGWREEVYCEHKFSRYNNWYGVRGARYKFAIYYDEPDGPYECLYDLERDPAEVTNLARNPEYAALRTRMKAKLDSYLKAFPRPEVTREAVAKKKKK
ncbi:MAG TPA: hypothetical protein DCR55_12385, partial [Lentisphaeria bacterium]|nr:hypothetical protein [Lentisphaeria bacterium]